MDESIDAFQIDEGAEVDDVADGALDDVADVQVVDDLLTHFLALFFQHGAAREHDVVAIAIHLDDAAADLLADVLLEVLDATDVDQRRGQEAAHAEIDDEAALDDFDDVAGDRLAALEGRFDALPCLLEAGALLAEDETPIGVFLGHDQRVDLFAEMHLVGGVNVLADAQFIDGDDALGLVADVDEDLVLVDADHVSCDDIAFGEDVDGDVVVGDDLAVDLDEVAFAALYDAGIVGRCELRVDWFFSHNVS